MIRKSPIRLAVALLVAGTFASAGFVLADRDGGSAAPALYAVKFHADWCGTCKRMGPAFEELHDRTDGEPVLFVVLDRTNRTTTSQASYLSTALGLEEQWTAHPGTGFVLLVDARTKQTVARLTADQDSRAMAKEVQAQLAALAGGA